MADAVLSVRASIARHTLRLLTIWVGVWTESQANRRLPSHVIPAILQRERQGSSAAQEGVTGAVATKEGCGG